MTGCSFKVSFFILIYVQEYFLAGCSDFMEPSYDPEVRIAYAKQS